MQSEEGSGNVLDSGGPRALETSLGDFKEKEGDDGAVSVLTVLKYPDPRLREVSSQISQFDEDLRAFAGDMVETMYAYRGIGLAAPQVGVNRCLIALDVEDLLEAAELPWRGGAIVHVNGVRTPLPFPWVLVNPELVDLQEPFVFGSDGCLSFPGVEQSETQRFRFCRLRSKDPVGRDIEISCDGILSICLQHEMDHLAGVLFIDRLTQKVDGGEVKEAVIKAAERDPLEVRLGAVDVGTRPYQIR